MNNLGKQFRYIVVSNHPLQIVGAINACSSLLAEQAGHKALCSSGGGVAASSYSISDLGITTLKGVLEDASRIFQASDLPLLVDIDTGWVVH